MKKYFLIVSLLCLSLNSAAQDLEKCGLDNNPFLTENEAVFLNKYFEEYGIDFKGKKVAFVTGSSGTLIRDKEMFFRDVKMWNEHNDKISAQARTLTNEEKKKSGEYDIIITFWVKQFTERRMRKILRELDEIEHKVDKIRKGFLP
ncbi:hypothetical protein [Yeosuana marina]|uniref:hypothetical protein n=1 Tax=Yeosuana marina TaxID=1565536 RepID=UPI00141EC822|nr:hypothetical protein [Yeosuana marina]